MGPTKDTFSAPIAPKGFTVLYSCAAPTKLNILELVGLALGRLVEGILEDMHHRNRRLSVPRGTGI